MEEEGLPGGYKDVQPGDCVVAFSRNDIYDIKATIESATGRRYGPLQARGAQACGGAVRRKLMTIWRGYTRGWASTPV